MNIGERIVARLEDLGWKRKDLLARVPELTPQALYALIKRGSARSEWDERIAEALGVSVLWLVYGKTDYVASRPDFPPYPAVGENIAKYPANELPPVIAKVVSLMKMMDETGRGAMMERAKMLAAEHPAQKASKHG